MKTEWDLSLELKTLSSEEEEQLQRFGQPGESEEVCEAWILPSLQMLHVSHRHNICSLLFGQQIKIPDQLKSLFG